MPQPEADLSDGGRASPVQAEVLENATVAIRLVRQVHRCLPVFFRSAIMTRWTVSMSSTGLKGR
jgi:hypothetical protein